MNEHELLASFFTTERVFTQPRLPSDSKLKKIIEVSLRKNRVLQEKPNQRDFYWDERRFRLNESDHFMALPEEIRTRTLQNFSIHSVVTSHFIEKAAISYCAKMALLADTLDEKVFFLSVGQEEVIHLVEIEQFLPAESLSNPTPSPFAQAMNQLIQTNDRETSFLVAQVLLEGMAMNHYGILSDCCIDDPMKKVIDRILIDEARHHGSGLVLLDEAALTDQQISHMASTTQKVLPLLMGQKNIVLKGIQSSAAQSGVNLSEEDLYKISLEIHLDHQMQQRISHIKDGIKKLKNERLRSLLLNIPEYGNG